MDSCLTLEQLESRWDKALRATRRAVADHPRTYRQLKAHAAAIIDSPIDIQDYFPTVEELTARLKTLDPCGHGSIFDFFNDRIAPTTIWHVKMLRMECTDLLAHLNAFDKWRRAQHRLRMIK